MATILPFLRKHDGTFDEAATQAMGEAFDAACEGCVFRKNRTANSLIAGHSSTKSRTAGRWPFSVAWLKSRGIRFLVFSVGQAGFWLSHALAFEVDAMGVVNDPVEDGIGDGRLTDHIVPLRDG